MYIIIQTFTVLVTELPSPNGLAKAIRKHFQNIIENVSSSDLSTYLFQEQVLTHREYQNISAEKVSIEQVFLWHISFGNFIS